MPSADLPRPTGPGGLGLVAALAALACIVISPRAGLTGWLAAAVMLQAVPLGALVLLAMMRLIPGAWAVDLRTACEAASGLWCLAALAFVPVLIGMGAIYDWPHAPPETPFQGVWLGIAPFIARTLAWFFVLGAVARSQVGGRAGEGACALALVLLTVGSSLLAVDWLMSLDTAFHSSGFGLQVLALEMCVAYLVVLLLRLGRARAVARPGVLGGLLITLLLLWLYFQFMPYLVTWSGNLPEGAAWYLRRGRDGWGWALAAAGLLGAGPLLALFLPAVRLSRRALALCALLALAGKAVEFAWIALPGRGAMAVLAYLLALAAFGGLAKAFLGPIGLPRGQAA